MFKKTIKIVLKITEWLLFVALIVLAFISISPTLPFENLPRTYTIRTGSMAPLIQPGSVAIVTSLDEEQINNLQKRDIIAFTSPRFRDVTVIHRIEEIASQDPLILITKGDNNDAVDPWEVYADDVTGRFIFSVPWLGHAAEFIKTPLGFGLIIGIPAILFIVSQIFSIKKGINEEVEKRLKKKEAETTQEKKKKGGSLKTILMLVLLLGISFYLGQNAAYAVFSDQVQISGITLSTKDF